MSEYDLVMPFVVCQSKGGIYDDDAYVAGWEAGHIDLALSLNAARGGPLPEGIPVHVGNRPQVDLIAMRHGFSVTFTESEYDEWCFATFARPTGEPS